MVSLSVPHAFATEGTCSWHGGVNCSAGADWDGSAVCNDGWFDSSERYFQQIKCQETPMCSQSQWIELSDTDVMNTDRSRFSQLLTLINTLNIEYPMIEIRLQQEAAGRGITAGGLAPIIRAAQRVNRNGVDTSTYEAQLLDQKLRAAQMEINKTCISSGVAKQQADSLAQQLRMQRAQAALQQAQPIQPTYVQNQSAQTTLIDPYVTLTSDDRCVKLNLGTFFNTEKQICDTCSSGTVRVAGTNSCEKPVPTVKKVVSTPKQEVSIQATSSMKTEPRIATTSQATTTPIKVNPPTSKQNSFWQKIASPFRSIWGRIFK
jgi:hypothetical protein